ncbi:hypothetical protein PHJA_002117000 [Phtheirospermum japonicum]|uniref:Myb/SANT-like domain-containing protein n=1 Tax=Phtheirospermum japonicum TaxID=374723 RepID=A0A830CL66_9LAMI|nr:hypothetical protein PHJA_002117000 [Phtheirospermum japonicum]
MASKYPVAQEEFLYNLGWTKEADKTFIGLLVDQRQLGLFKPGEPNLSSIEFCTDILNINLGTSYNHAYCIERVALLQNRYRVFRWMLRKHGLRHCKIIGLVTAPKEVWDDIFEKEPFSIAYQEYGEPMWNELRVIFEGVYGSHPTPEDVVIQVSSHHGVMPIPPTGTRRSKAIAPKRVINVEASSSVKSCSLWKYLEAFVGEDDTTFESSVNQPPQSPEHDPPSLVSGTTSPP